MLNQPKVRARQKGDSKREKPDPERTFSQIFADFRNRRKPQIFAGNRRKPQIFAETGFSHLLSPFWRAPTRGLSQEAVQYLPKCCSRKMLPSFYSFQWRHLLERSFLEHFCLDKFSVIQGKFHMQRFSNTSLGRTLPGSNFGASCSNKLFVGAPSHFPWKGRSSGS